MCYLCQGIDRLFEGFREIPVLDGELDFVLPHLDLVLSVSGLLIFQRGDQKGKLG